MPHGGRVGTVGTANGSYPAHLHFEIRASDGVDIGAGYAMYPLNRLDPAATLASVLAGNDTSWTTSEIEGAEKFFRLLDEAE